MAETISIIVAVAIMIAIPIGIVRGLSGGVQQKPQQSGSGGGFIGSAMLEMDRLVRPSNGHIVQAEEEMKRHEDGIGGE